MILSLDQPITTMVLQLDLSPQLHNFFCAIALDGDVLQPNFSFLLLSEAVHFFKKLNSVEIDFCVAINLKV
jgi:hypothetical protein